MSANRELLTWIEQAGIAQRCLLLGPIGDMRGVFNALDLLVCASLDEAFPLVLGEAMACGVPCVTTDAGDAAWIVGDTGTVVPVGDSQALAREMLGGLSLPVGERLTVGRAARLRIEERFALEGVTRAYERLYLDLAAGERDEGLGLESRDAAAR